MMCKNFEPLVKGRRVIDRLKEVWAQRSRETVNRLDLLRAAEGENQVQVPWAVEQQQPVKAAENQSEAEAVINTVRTTSPIVWAL
jgi:hypothetical protein